MTNSLGLMGPYSVIALEAMTIMAVGKQAGTGAVAESLHLVHTRDRDGNGVSAGELRACPQ